MGRHWVVAILFPRFVLVALEGNGNWQAGIDGVAQPGGHHHKASPISLSIEPLPESFDTSKSYFVAAYLKGTLFSIRDDLE
jgi:hypothetical protein